MTATDTEKAKQAMRDQWSAAAAVWGKWHREFSAMSHDVTEAIVAEADLAPGMNVLDLAGGTGEPALSVARLVGEQGSVTMTDFVEPMIAVAERNAREAGLKNVTFRQVDAENIPFDDACYDRVTCRFGVMFFPDPQKALGEIKRVLKPGGKAAFTVWAPTSENPGFQATTGYLIERGIVQPPPPGALTPQRFQEPGSITRELTAAGFSDVREEPRRIAWAYPGTADQYFEFFKGTFPAIRGALAEMSEADAAAVARDVIANIAKYHDGTKLAFGATIYVASGAV
jgi:ubiquinone/menaquinone biosynthesis C-methylase UbiE